MNTFDNSGGQVPPTYTRIGGNRPRRNYNHRRPPRWRAFIAAVIGVLLLVWGYWFILLLPYTPFTNGNEVAQITAVQSREGLHQLSIQVIRFDANGYEKPDPHPYLIQGDKVELKYEYVTLPDWLGFFGLHSGYILIGLQGVYSNGTLGTPQSLNTPDDVQLPLVSPHFSSVTILPDKRVQTLHISSQGQIEP